MSQMGLLEAKCTKAAKKFALLEANGSQYGRMLRKEMKKLGLLAGMGIFIIPWEKKWKSIHLIILVALFVCVSGFAMCLLKFMPPAVAAALRREADSGGGMMLMMDEETEKRYSTSTDHITSSMFVEPTRSQVASTLFCDRSSYRTDVCNLKGDIRTQASSSTIFLISDSVEQEEQQTIKPYTRKWENDSMVSVTQLNLKTTVPEEAPRCQVTHTAPALIFSTAGYTGNLFHDFTDVIVPLFIISHRFNRDVVFLILDYKPWWVGKFREIFNQLSRFEPLNFAGDKRVHCFTETVVGLPWHADLMVDPQATPGNATIEDFRNMLANAYRNSVPEKPPPLPSMPKLVLIARKGSRRFLNQRRMVRVAEKMGFRVRVLTPDINTKLKDMFDIINDCDVLMGVHGAALTHFVFLPPGAVFIQVVPLGIEWASKTFFREPAMKMKSIHYIEYPILVKESSLCDDYPMDHPYLRDPRSVNGRGWDATKKVYLDRQNVRLHIPRFKKLLRRTMQRLQPNA